MKVYFSGFLLSEFDWGIGEIFRRLVRISEKVKVVFFFESEFGKKRRKKSFVFKKDNSKENEVIVEEEIKIGDV